MSNGPIPSHVDPRKLADRQTTLEGQIDLADLPRLRDALADDAGIVRVKLHFTRDEQNTAVICSDLTVEVRMVCQRCLELVALPIHSECKYAVVWPGANTQSLPREYDALEVGEEPLKLLTLIEDELLLALPIIPVHAPEDCQSPAGVNQPEPSEDEVSRSNPFSVLAQLKRDPKA